jgi:polysaccharide biosynthesis/export protein
MRFDLRKPQGWAVGYTGLVTIACSFSSGIPLAQASSFPPSSLVAARVNPTPINPMMVEGQTDGDGYILGAGDRVKVDFVNVPEYTAEFPVLPNGTIQFPLVGAINVKGLSLTETGTIVTTKFRPYFKKSIATVTLISARPLGVSISGEVNRPGSYTLLSTSTTAENSIPSLSRVLQMAEGVTQIADLRNVKITRRLPGGRNQPLNVNLWKLVKEGDNSQDLRLQDGDSIYIPTAEVVDLKEARQLSRASFATKLSRPLKVVVVGEVNRPGPHTIAETIVSNIGDARGTSSSQVPTVTQALQIAGGITQQADVRGIEVRRLTHDGKQQTIPVSFWELLNNGDANQDLPLQDGDTIVIPMATTTNDREITQLARASFSPDKVSVNVVGQVEKPGSIQLPPNTPMNQAILAAGGFTQKAQSGTVTLVRLNPNGTVTKRDIAIDFTQDVNDQGNPALRPNDTIVVKQSGFSRARDEIGSFLNPVGAVTGILRLFGL